MMNDPSDISPMTYATFPRNKTQNGVLSSEFSRPTMITRTYGHNGATRTHFLMVERRERLRICHTPIIHPRWHRQQSHRHIILVSMAGETGLWPHPPQVHPPLFSFPTTTTTA